MKKFFKRFLCMIAFVVFAVVCARADSSILVVENLTPAALQLIESNSIHLSRTESGLRVFKARVILFNKQRRYAVLSVDSGFHSAEQESQARYWLRSDKLLERVYMCGLHRRYLTRSGSMREKSGTLSHIVTIASRLNAAAVSDTRTVSLPSDNSDESSDEGSSADLDDQYDVPEFPSASSPDSSTFSSASLEERSNFRLTVMGPNGVPIVFEGTTFCDDATLESLVGCTITGIEKM